LPASRPVDGISFDIAAGECYALLGESGCGKSMTALGLMRLLPPGARATSGTVSFAGRELLALPEASMREYRGGHIGMIFQEPATSLNPVLTVGRQIVEALELHSALRGEAARGAPRSCSTRSAFPMPNGGSTNFPSSFPADCASA
jgi:peptide/nickel transport system ATP-binding protein